MGDIRKQLGGMRRKPGAIEALESRQLLSTVPAHVALLAATTADSKGVTVGYQVANASLGRPLVLGVYRSASPTFDANAIPVGTATVPVSAVDQAGNPATVRGTHQITVPIAGGLPPNPLHPYVLVVADPGTPAATAPDHTASFRKRVIGVIVHGGVQPQGWKHNGPPWESKMAASLRAEGYDDVIAYNWVADSIHAGSAAKQGPRLAHLIDQAALAMAPNQPVDLHIIGHSEGTVVASLALNDLQPPPNLTQGFKELTFLDPHAAGNGFRGTQFSVSNSLLGSLAREQITAFQARANDPAPVVQANVNDAQVYFQHTPISAAHGSNGGLYNLWGQVPVPAANGVPVHYANLTGSGISHAGDFGVYDWYQVNVVPHLGNGPAFFNPSDLTANHAISTTAPNAPSTFSGTATPGATIDVYAQPYGTTHKTPIGQTIVDAQGRWSFTTETPTSRDIRYLAHARVIAAPGLNRVYVSPTVVVNGS